MGDSPRLRHAVRVLLLDEEDRVLLLHSIDPQSGRAFWFPPGGGNEGNEDERAAAMREVAEETGLADVELGPEVWRRRHVLEWRGTTWDQRERWLLARVEAFVVTREQLTEEEHEDIGEARWWTLGELAATPDALVPRDLARLLAALVDDGPPREPVEIGA